VQEHDAAMKVFLSYYRHDEGAAGLLVGDLQRAQVQVRLDVVLEACDTGWR
jgi:hypothetical protein